MAPVPDEQGPVDLEETQGQRSPSSSDWPPFDVTIFSDLSGGRFRVEPHTLGTLANLCFTRRASKGACELLKLAIFGEIRSNKGSLRHDANVVGICGVEVDYDAEEISFADAR
jgi:hypothetical protein